ncbi:biopolymer transporter ExbD [bacterium]|nr:biopolymer transporter ExbD [bacterium]
MGVIIPGYHIKSEYDLEEMRFKLRGLGKQRALSQELTLTSMIDMFAVIIIFLIQTFSASGELVFVHKDITLPDASHGQLIEERAPIITVMADRIIIEGTAADSNQDIEDKVEETDWKLPLMQQKLNEYRQFWETYNPGTKFPGEVYIQADKELDFLYLKRVLFTLVKLEFTSIKLATRGDPDPKIYTKEKEELSN